MSVHKIIYEHRLAKIGPKGLSYARRLPQGKSGGGRGKKKKIMMEIVATNIVASRPPEQWLIEMPSVCAN